MSINIKIKHSNSLFKEVFILNRNKLFMIYSYTLYHYVGAQENYSDLQSYLDGQREKWQVVQVVDCFMEAINFSNDVI